MPLDRWRGILPAVVVGAALAATPVSAQTPPPSCAADEYRLFDFWEGTWSVEPRVRPPANTNPPSESTITRLLRGCAIHEHYKTAAGYEGESFNIYDRTRGVWHQTWVDNTGLLLRIEGHFEDGRMVLEGPGTNAQGQAILNRITWHVIDGDPDRVSQVWQVSVDGGESWTTSFDGVYTRVERGR